MKTESSFGIIPIYDKTEVLYLLVQHHAGHWGFPKGHAEEGESPYETACREFEEETGIRTYKVISPETLSEQYKIIKKDREILKTVTYYIAEVNDQSVEFQQEEINDYGWFNFEECLTKISFEESKSLLKRADERYKNAK